MSVDESIKELNKICEDFVDKSKSPLLIMYYPDSGGSVEEDDVELLYSHLRDNNLSVEKPLHHLTVILHTLGGSPDVAYQMAQLIRDFFGDVYIIVPYVAASAGTVFCFCANKIYLGTTARLGAIDVSINNIELAAISQFLKFSLDAREELEKRLLRNKIHNKESSVESDLLVELVRFINPINVGAFYRRRDISSLYSSKLLQDYLFGGLKNRKDKAKELTQILTNEIPAHDFILDYYMCHEIGLPVERLKESFFDEVRKIIKLLESLTDAGVICKDLPKIDNEIYKDPFFQFYNHKPRNAQNGANK